MSTSKLNVKYPQSCWNRHQNLINKCCTVCTMWRKFLFFLVSLTASLSPNFRFVSFAYIYLLFMKMMLTVRFQTFLPTISICMELSWIRFVDVRSKLDVGLPVGLLYFHTTYFVENLNLLFFFCSVNPIDNKWKAPNPCLKFHKRWDAVGYTLKITY